MKLDANNVEAYYDAVPPERKKAMRALRSLILTEAPGVDESFKYGLPFYSLDGQPFIALASQKHYIALYLNLPRLITKFKPKLGKVNTGKNCIRFNMLENVKIEALGMLIAQAYSERIGRDDIKNPIKNTEASS